MADHGVGDEYSGVADHGYGTGDGNSRRPDQGGGDQYSGGADHGYGGGYSSGANHSDGDECSRGSDHECGSRPIYGRGARPLASESEGDIEQPAASAANSNMSMESTLDESRVADNNSEPGLLVKLLTCLLQYASILLLYAVYITIFVVVIVIKGSTSNSWVEDYRYKPSNEEKKGGIMSKKPALKVKLHDLTIVTLVRMGCVVSIWMVINLRVPSLRSMPLLGSQLWRWSLLAAITLLGYPILLMLYYMIKWLTEALFSKFNGSNVEYCMKGLTSSMVLVQYFTTILLVWLLCVDTSNASLRRYGSLTLASFLVGAVLSILKSAVLLWWKAKAIYKKYKGKILSAGCQLYIHLLIVERKKEWASHQLVVWGEPMKYKLKPSVANDPGAEAPEDYDGRAAVKRRKILPIEDYMLKKNVSLEYVHEIATHLMNNFELTLTEDDDIPDIAIFLRQQFSGSEFSIHDLIRESCLDTFGKELLQDLLEVETSKKDVTYEEFEKWMVDGLKNCYSVGNRINGAMEAMRLLDRVLKGLIVLMVALVWIFITGFATTSVVVGLASMFLGLTFVFGDTCKTFFQGVIFAFVTRPFDVGDRCIVDDKELKVKKINILTTTFFGSQSKEVVTHPNSDLSIKQIVVLLHGERISESNPKLHGILGPQLIELEDVIELVLPCATKALHIKSLLEDIKGYLEVGIDYGNFKKPYWVTVDVTGEGIKMGVHFHHNLNNGDEGDELETPMIRKENRRLKLFLLLKELQEKIENEA